MTRLAQADSPRRSPLQRHACLLHEAAGDVHGAGLMSRMGGAVGCLPRAGNLNRRLYGVCQHSRGAPAAWQRQRAWLCAVLIQGLWGLGFRID